MEEETKHIRQKDAACVVWPWRDTRSPRSHRRAHPARDNDDCDCCDDASWVPCAPCAPWPAPVWVAALSLWPSWCAHACDASPARGCVSCVECEIGQVNGMLNVNGHVNGHVNDIGYMLCVCVCRWRRGEADMPLKAWPLHLLKLLVWWMAACQDKHHASDKQQT